MKTAADMVHLHDVHPPDEVRVFAVPPAAIRRWDDATIVYEVWVSDRVLRHYAFVDRWFAVNCTLDLEGHFVTEEGPIAWCFNCDITTPLVSIGSNLYRVDLALDVLVGPDGRSHVVKDEDDFVLACKRGWLSEAEQVGAREGLAELLEIIADGGLLAYLDAEFRFGSLGETVAALPMVTLRATDGASFHEITRHRSAQR